MVNPLYPMDSLMRFVLKMTSKSGLNVLENKSADVAHHMFKSSVMR